VTVGVLCAEHTRPRVWTLDEQHFAIAMPT
jgi:GAF domain-containing protein